MKKILLVGSIMILMIALLAGCASGAATGVKTGLGQNISVAKSKDATADAVGLVEADVVMASVSVDSAGKIVSVTIDMAQTKVNFDATGKLTTDLTAEQKTKVELGDAYGMKAQSGIGKEWYEQMDALEAWMIGKTIEEVKAMKMTAEGTPDEADLKTSVTVHVSDYIAAVEEAVKNAK